MNFEPHKEDIMTDLPQTVSKTDRKAQNVAAHNARNAAMKVEGDARRAEKRAAGMEKQASYLQSLKDGAVARKAERIQAHNDRNAAMKKAA